MSSLLAISASRWSRLGFTDTDSAHASTVFLATVEIEVWSTPQADWRDVYSLSDRRKVTTRLFGWSFTGRSFVLGPLKGSDLIAGELNRHGALQ